MAWQNMVISATIPTDLVDRSLDEIIEGIYRAFGDEGDNVVVTIKYEKGE